MSLAALLAIGGGHWAVLQTVAWARMIVDYTHDSGSLRQGVAETFDGAHPCELCRKISSGIVRETREQRQKPRAEDRLGKIVLTAVLPTVFSAPPARPEMRLAGEVVSLCGRLADAPPVPPPRRS